MVKHDFISLVQTTLKEAAEDIPEDTNLFPQIRQHLFTEHTVKSQPVPFWHKRRLGLASGLLVAVVIIFSGFTFAVPALFSWLGDASLQQITLDHATQINRQVTVDGITIHLDQAYADATRTAITFHVVSSSSVTPSPLFPILTDEHNQTYNDLIGQQIRDQALVEFAPLPPDALKNRQKLTFVVKTMIMHNATGRSEATLNGPWSITFQLQPLIDRSVRLTNTQQVHHGLTIEPVQLDFAPSGARLLIQISGLAPDTSLNTLAEFVTHRTINGISPTDHIGTNLEGTSEGALLQLHLPDGQVLVPAMVQLWDNTAHSAIKLTADEQTVGASGKVFLQVLFFTALPVTQGAATLTVDQLRIAPASAKQYTTVTGPWTFPISLQRS